MPPPFEKVWEDASLIEGLLPIEEARAIYEIARGVPPEQMIVEVGCYHGRSTTVLANSGRKVWTVDPMEIGHTNGSYCISEDDVETLRLNLSPHPHVMWKRQTTTSVETPIDAVGMLFIDGDHEGDWPLRDFERFEPHLVIASKVVFHDYGDSANVRGTVDVLVEQTRLRVINVVGACAICVKTRPSYSQADEDQIVQSFFGEEKGRFLDVGAWDGVDISNTRLLAEEGWSGVCVEPAVGPFDKLACHYAGFPKIELVHAAIMPRRGLLRFWDTGDALSSFNQKHVSVWRDKAGVPFRQIWTPAIMFADLFESLPGKYDFVSLDVEGHSVDLLEAFDPIRAGTRLMCVEDDGRLSDINKWAERYGFHRVARTPENVLLGRASA